MVMYLYMGYTWVNLWTISNSLTILECDMYYYIYIKVIILLKKFMIRYSAKQSNEYLI